MGNTAHIIIGSGLEHHFRSEGKFDIHYMGAVLTFENLADAVQLYNCLQGEVYIWDVTQGATLLEAKLLVSHNPLRIAFKNSNAWR